MKLFTAAATLALITTPAIAQYQMIKQYDQKVKAGQSTRIYSWWNCNRPRGFWPYRNGSSR